MAAAERGDVKAMQLRMREDMNRFASDFLRVERMEAETQVRLDRIEQRLNLSDAE
jgi:excinuclease UvrABC nuclease subunit